MLTTIPPASQPISPVDAIWAIIQSQSQAVRQAIFLRVEKEEQQRRSVAEKVLEQLSKLEEGPAGFLRLDSILPPSPLSAEELCEDAYTEKYGI